jgi:hypothetical protein
MLTILAFSIYNGAIGCYSFYGGWVLLLPCSAGLVELHPVACNQLWASLVVYWSNLLPHSVP